MKKILYFLAVLTMATFVSSCAKTNKRKFSSDWTVTYDEAYFTTGDAQEFWTGSVVLDNGTATSISDVGFAGSISHTTTSGPVIRNTFTIKKEGTWSRHQEYELLSPDGKTVYTNTSYGNWSFLGKSRSGEEDFRRRDRVMFTVIKKTEHRISYNLIDGNYLLSDEELIDLTTDTEQETMIYVITESKHKELHLEQEGVNSTQLLLGSGPQVGLVLNRARLVLKAK